MAVSSANATLSAVSFSAAALANAVALGVDLKGNLAAAQGKLAELLVAIQELKREIPASDPTLLAVCQATQLVQVLGYLRFNDINQSGHIATIFVYS